MPYDLWAVVLRFHCTLPIVTVVEGGEDYGRLRDAVKLERRRLREVCWLFASVVRDLEAADIHFELPWFCDDEKRLELIMKSSPSCVRWTLQHLSLSAAECAVVREAWARTSVLQRLDVDVTLCGTRDGAHFVVDDEARTVFLDTLRELFAINSRTFTNLDWSSGPDAMSVIRLTSPTLSTLSISTSTADRQSGWNSMHPPLTWTCLKFLRVIDIFESSSMHSLILRLFCADDTPSLEDFLLFSRGTVPGVQAFLEKNSGIKKLSLNVAALFEGESIPEQCDVQELHACLFLVDHFLRTVRPKLKNIYVTPSRVPSTHPTASSHRAAILLERIADAFDSVRSPSLVDITLEGITSHVLTEGGWHALDFHRASTALDVLRDKKMKVNCCDGQSFQRLRKRFKVYWA
ncbi:hypothetical protein SCHPADRAFT_946307 [Schizopora paradoxa]|uniref:F-box domain-containing protein n=1 Tax=Schizopora paradoxa TaxID=27342 RepID=A0A0H2R9M0_9AGAM|nr:hypothetical protein SCHPADRAFT_946307 [Schizopora paradoxa]